MQLLPRRLPRLVEDGPAGPILLPLAALEFESPSAAIIATRVPPVARATNLFVFLLVAALLAAGGLIQIDKIVSATGKLVLYPTADGFDGARRQLELQRALGSEQHAVSAAECVAIEPALSHHQGQIAGAIHTPSECAADCLKTCEGLHQVLRAQGVRFELGSEVQGFVQRGGAVVALATTL